MFHKCKFSEVVSGADLCNADLRLADLSERLLANVAFCGADLSFVSFVGSDLSYANFYNANIQNTIFAGAIMGNAIFTNAHNLWTAHEVVGELLKREADRDLEKLKVAGLVTISPDWLEMAEDLPKSEQAWVIEILTPHLNPDDDLPRFLAK